MTQQNINFGTTRANDGEDLFSAFTKIQANFSELYTDATSDAAALAAHIADTSAAHDASAVSFTQSGTGAVERTAQAKMRDIVSVKDFGATGDGVADDTAEIQAALDTGADVFIPKGTYKITGTIIQKLDGQRVYGSGKYNTIITNTTDADPLWVIGSTGGAGNRGQFCALEKISLIGNALTTEGLALYGIIDDSASGAARDCRLDDIYISSVGAGFGFRVSSWENTCTNVTIFSCNKGLKLGAECNACTFDVYISNCTNEGIVNATTSGLPATINFTTATVQYCGGTNGSIDLNDIFGIKFGALYLEGSTAPASVYMTSGCKAAQFDLVSHSLATGTATKVIVATDVKGLHVGMIDHRGGAMASLVEINGTLPVSNIGVLQVSAGSVTAVLVDNSTRRATNYLNGLTNTFGPVTITNAADAAANEALVIQSKRATPADNDSVYVPFKLADDSGALQEFGRLTVQGTDVNVATSIDGRMLFGITTAGSFINELQLTGTNLAPFADDGLALGISGTGFADLFLASGAVINFNAGDVTVTHAADTLTIAGAATVVDVQGPLQADSFRIDQAASSVGTGSKTISNAADSSTNFGKYFSFSLNGTTVYVPCGTVAPT